MADKFEQRRHHMLQATDKVTERRKMYKAGKLWLAAGMTAVAFGATAVMTNLKVVSADDQTTDAQQVQAAATAKDTGAPTDASKADASASTNKSIVILKTAPKAQPAVNAGSTASAAEKPSDTKTAPAATDADTTTPAAKPASQSKPVSKSQDSTNAAQTTIVSGSNTSAKTPVAAAVVKNTKPDYTNIKSDPAAPADQKIKPEQVTAIKGDATQTQVTAAQKNAAAVYKQTGVAQKVTAADEGDTAVAVTTKTYYYGDSADTNSKDTADSVGSPIGLTDGQLDAGQVDAMDKTLAANAVKVGGDDSVYTVQAGNETQLYNSVKARAAADPALTADTPLNVVYYPAVHFAYHDDAGKVRLVDKDVKSAAKAALVTSPTSLTKTVANVRDGKINMTAFNTALNLVVTDTKKTVTSRKTTINAYMKTLATFKDGKTNANLVQTEDVNGNSDPTDPGQTSGWYTAAVTYTGDNFETAMGKLYQELTALQTGTSYSDDSSDASNSDEDSSNSQDASNSDVDSNTLKAIKSTLGDLSSGLTVASPYTLEPYLGPAYDGMTANPTLNDAVMSLAEGVFGTQDLEDDQAAQVNGLIYSLQKAANDRDTLVAAVKNADSLVDSSAALKVTLPILRTEGNVVTAGTVAGQAVNAALTTLQTTLHNAQISTDLITGSLHQSNNAQVIDAIYNLGTAVTQDTAPYSLEPEVIKAKTALLGTLQVTATKPQSIDNVPAILTQLSNFSQKLDAAKTARDKAIDLAKQAAETMNKIPDAVKAGTLTGPNTTDVASNLKTLEDTQTAAAADQKTTQDILDSINFKFATQRTVTYRLADLDNGVTYTLPAGESLPKTTTQKVTWTYKIDPNDPTRLTFVPESPSYPDDVAKLSGFTATAPAPTKLTLSATGLPTDVQEAQITTLTPNPAKATIKIGTVNGKDVTTDVTGVTGQTIQIPVPIKDGYKVDRSTVPALVNDDGTITIKPIDQAIYTALEQTGAVQYIDVTDANKPVKVGSDVPVSGKTDATINFTAVAPAGYELANAKQTTVPIKFAAKSDNVVKINVIRSIKHSQLTTKNYVDYKGLPTGKLPASQLAVANFDVATDMKTNVSTYTPVEPTATITNSQIAGYSVAGTTVLTFKAGTDKPMDTHTAVTYTALPQQFDVNLVDGSGNVLKTVTVKGKTDGAIDYTPVNAAITELKKDDNVNKVTTVTGLDKAPKQFGVNMPKVELAVTEQLSKQQVGTPVSGAQLTLTLQNGTTPVGDPVVLTAEAGTPVDITKVPVPAGYKVVGTGKGTPAKFGDGTTGTILLQPTTPQTDGSENANGQHVFTKVQTNGDVEAVGQVTINFAGNDGKFAGSQVITEPVGTPISINDVKIPDGFKSTQVTGMPEKVAGKPVTVVVTVQPATPQTNDTESAPGQHVSTKVQTNGDVEAAGQVTINFVGNDGRSAGSQVITKPVGTPISKDDVNVPAGFKRTDITGLPAKVTDTPVTVTVHPAVPATSQTDGTENAPGQHVYTKIQSGDVSRASQVTVAFVGKDGKTVDTQVITKEVGTPVTMADVKVPDGFTDAEIKLPPVVTSQPQTVTVTAQPTTQTKTSVDTSVPASQITVTFTDNNGNPVGTQVLTQDVGTPVNAADITVPNGYHAVSQNIPDTFTAQGQTGAVIVEANTSAATDTGLPDTGVSQPDQGQDTTDSDLGGNAVTADNGTEDNVGLPNTGVANQPSQGQNATNPDQNGNTADNGTEAEVGLPSTGVSDKPSQGQKVTKAASSLLPSTGVSSQSGQKANGGQAAAGSSETVGAVAAAKTGKTSAVAQGRQLAQSKDQASSAKGLPQTGDSQNAGMSLLGMLALALTSIGTVVFKRHSVN